jgi:putative transposase
LIPHHEGILAIVLLSRYYENMPTKNIQRVDRGGICLHVYNRGILKETLFHDEQDYEVFLGYLRDYLIPLPSRESIKKPFTVRGRAFSGIPHQPKNYYDKVGLIAYSLRPTHFHLLLRQKTRGSLQRFMRSLSTRYSMYFNKKYQRSGPLLDGPYKSIQIDDATHLLYLTRYFHHHPREGKGDDLIKGYSSYADYLGKRETPWVKVDTVLSFFENFKNGSLKGIKSYKDFVEKYSLNQKEKELLEKIIIEKESGHLERSMLTAASDTTPEPIAYTPLKIQQRLPELAIASFVFAILFTSSFLNIWSSPVKAKGSAPSPIRQASEQASKQTLGQASELEEDIQQEDIQPKTMLVVKIDESASVNIRQGPTTSSKVIGKAKNGDTFEFISENSGWYEVKLDDGSTAFISASYVEISEEIEGTGN